MSFVDYYRVIPGKGQNVAIGAASVASTAFGQQTYAVRLTSTGNCHVAFGPAPTATAVDTLVSSAVRGEVFKVNPGDKVAVIQDGTATGNLNIQELSA